MSPCTTVRASPPGLGAQAVDHRLPSTLPPRPRRSPRAAGRGARGPCQLERGAVSLSPASSASRATAASSSLPAAHRRRRRLISGAKLSRGVEGHGIGPFDRGASVRDRLSSESPPPSRCCTHIPTRPRKCARNFSCSCAGYVARTVSTSSASNSGGRPSRRPPRRGGAGACRSSRVALVLEVVVGQPPVGRELLVVGQVLAVGDLEIAPRCRCRSRGAAGDHAVHRPPHQRRHRPREVVVQAT